MQDLSGFGRILDLDVEHLGEVLAETVGGSGLDSSTGGRDETFDGGGEETSGELLVLGFDSLDHGDGEEFLVDSTVEVEDLVDFGFGFGSSEEGGVSFLPEELSSSEEGFWRRRREKVRTRRNERKDEEREC